MIYNEKNSTILFNSKSEFGSLLNMTMGFPIIVNFDDNSKYCASSSEAIYQALKYSHRPDIQKEILESKNGFTCKKMVHEPNIQFEDKSFQEYKLEVMFWILLQKYKQNKKVQKDLLDSTTFENIVEYSKKDRYWGAIPIGNGDYEGNNYLGRLWMKIRQDYNKYTDFKPQKEFYLLDKKLSY